LKRGVDVIKNNIGKELKKADKSQAWLSLFTGISTGMVSQLVSGRSIPTQPELSLMCAAFLCHQENLYSADVLALIKGTEKPEQVGGKSYRGKHVLLTDELAGDVDAYGARYGLTRNEASRTLIIIGLRDKEPVETVAVGADKNWLEEVLKNVEANSSAGATDPADG